MKVVRVHLKGYTASFRYPIFISGFQPTLPVPPLSTIYGILSSAKGEIVTPEDTKVGYIFQSSSKFIDLESIYELDEKNIAKTNVCKREVLFEPEIYIYIEDINFKDYFKTPYYQLLLGRSQDIAMVDEIKEIELKKADKMALFGGTTVPFPKNNIFGMIQALPSHFTDTIPRKTVGVKPYHVVEGFRSIPINEYYYDEELNMGVYIHE
ncbi:MAG: type I-B CRISPR-associated protein Cas5b [Caloramator sp.]|nr:type I-B CRISPR-associated protein Cas5b [Caloramator sp.]